MLYRGSDRELHLTFSYMHKFSILTALTSLVIPIQAYPGSLKNENINPHVPI